MSIRNITMFCKFLCLKHLLRLDSIIPRQVKRELLEVKEIPCCEQRDGWKEDPTEDGRRAGISGERDGEESLLKQKRCQAVIRFGFKLRTGAIGTVKCKSVISQGLLCIPAVVSH